MESDLKTLQELVIKTLDEFKANDICVLDVRGKTSITDLIVIASATSSRQAGAMAVNLLDTVKNNGFEVLGVEGEKESEWILIDLGDAVVHIMLPATRAFYQLEKLWQVDNWDSQAEAAVKHKAPF